MFKGGWDSSKLQRRTSFPKGAESYTNISFSRKSLGQPITIKHCHIWNKPPSRWSDVLETRFSSTTNLAPPGVFNNQFINPPVLIAALKHDSMRTTEGILYKQMGSAKPQNNSISWIVLSALEKIQKLNVSILATRCYTRAAWTSGLIGWTCISHFGYPSNSQHPFFFLFWGRESPWYHITREDHWTSLCSNKCKWLKENAIWNVRGVIDAYLPSGK